MPLATVRAALRAYVALALLAGSPALAAPPTRPSPYRDALARALLPPGGCVAQLVAIPAFGWEWSVCVSRDDAGRVTVVSAQMDPSLHGELSRLLHEKPLPDGSIRMDAEREAEVLREFTPNVRRHSAPLSAGTSKAVEALWHAALRHEYVRPFGLDGVTYELAAGTREPTKGLFFAWSPAPETREAQLVAFAGQLAAYAEAAAPERAALERALARDAEALRAVFDRP